MKHIKTFDSSTLADGAIIDAPFIGVVIDEEDENNNINVYKSNESDEDELYGIFINGSEIKYDKVPAIPMLYLYFLMLYLYPESPLFKEELYELAINSYAGLYIDYGIIKFPHSELKYNILDVDDFFDSIDNDGIAHKNNFFRHPIFYTFEEICHLLSYFNFNEDVVEIIILESSIDETNALLEYLPRIMHDKGTVSVFNFNYYKTNEYLYDFNSSQSMTFYDDIELCIIEHSEYSTYILQIYPIINNIDPINYIFVLKLNNIAKILQLLLAEAVIGYIADNDVYFSFIPYIQKEIK